MLARFGVAGGDPATETFTTCWRDVYSPESVAGRSLHGYRSSLISIFADRSCSPLWLVVVIVDRVQTVDDVLAGLRTPYEFRQPRIIRLQRVPNNRPTLRIDRPVAQHRLRSSFERIND